MSKEIIIHNQEQPINFSLIENVMIKGDLSKLTDSERVHYYKKVCDSVGLNPLTRPFDYIHLSGKLTLYARKDCTEQLRKIHGVSVQGLDDKVVDDIYIVKAKVRDKTGRMDESTGAVNIGKLTGENKANAIMKCETKAKRRATLSICGLGFLDETEVDSVAGAEKVAVNMETGQITVQCEDLSKKQPQNDEDLSKKDSSCEDNTKKPTISAQQLQEINHLHSQVDALCKENFKAYLLKEYQATENKDIPLEAFGACARGLWGNIEMNKNNKKQ